MQTIFADKLQKLLQKQIINYKADIFYMELLNDHTVFN